ncbi:MAG: chemotaxis protein CheW [Gloeomargarita sp. SKYBB_i_bin120]|nr:chemotaxis protein CheW [Gloeomargarita sp. SKYG98]MCS7293317.1 chemotaxis protein CheW [Gloeomargarita sp. SKYB120]MDW8178882.1 chemotaxis protein CheW [Gloeomargarita sp. SKYBB_i_bin120]
MTDTLLCLSFHLAPDTLALIPARDCLEVMPLARDQVVPIPEMPPAVMGVTNWRGEVLWLVDLAYGLGFAPLPELYPLQSSYYALILMPRDQRLGVVVAQVGQILTCPLNEVQSPPGTTLTAALAQCLRGYWLTNDNRTFLVLDTQGLVGALATSQKR